MFLQLPSVPTQLCGGWGWVGRACGLGEYGCLGLTVSEVTRQLE